jgi:hypothetical protein
MRAIFIFSFTAYFFLITFRKIDNGVEIRYDNGYMLTSPALEGRGLSFVKSFSFFSLNWNVYPIFLTGIESRDPIYALIPLTQQFFQNSMRVISTSFF